MTSQQYSAIYRALFDMRIHALAELSLAKYDFQKSNPQRMLDEAQAAEKALKEAFDASAFLRGHAPCPECGEYLGFEEEPEAEEAEEVEEVVA